jgi:hypothetical protein
MFRKLGTPLLIGLLLAFSLLVFLIQYFVFHRTGETVFYFLQDLAFVPISVLLVTLGLNTVMVRHERQQKLDKVSLLINEFYAEAGYDLLVFWKNMITAVNDLGSRLQPGDNWCDQDFRAAAKFLAQHPVAVTAVQPDDLLRLHELLKEKKSQILHLFENASLMEHDKFTDMLWAVYHVHDELRSRGVFDHLPERDLAHLAGDIQRGGQALLLEWINSMRLLKANYPYLFSLAVRKSPFGPGDPVIHDHM